MLTGAVYFTWRTCVGTPAAVPDLLPNRTYLNEDFLATMCSFCFVGPVFNCGWSIPITRSIGPFFFEIQSGFKDNLICAVIYRHPHGDLETFMAFLNKTMIQLTGRRNTAL